MARADRVRVHPRRVDHVQVEHGAARVAAVEVPRVIVAAQMAQHAARPRERIARRAHESEGVLAQTGGSIDQLGRAERLVLLVHVDRDVLAVRVQHVVVNGNQWQSRGNQEAITWQCACSTS